MAGDLIPPPSPAGKPSADPPPPDERHERSLFASPPAASDPTEEVLVASRPDDPREEVVTGPPVASPYKSRFGFITGALAGMGVAALIVTSLLIFGGGGSGGDSERGTWSAFQPTADDTFGAAEEIAAYVGQKYRIADGSQLVSIQSGPLALRDLPVQVVVRTAAVGGDIVPVSGKGLLYTLNGLGQNGSISKGKASVERLALLKRQALELSLYSFHYLDDIDHIVTLLPPPPPDTLTEEQKAQQTEGAAGLPTVTALLYRPGDLRRQLEIPVDLTIPPKTPRPETMSRREAELYTAATAGHTFTATFQQGPNAQVLLVLERPQQVLPGATPTPTPTPSAKPKASKTP